MVSQSCARQYMNTYVLKVSTPLSNSEDKCVSNTDSHVETEVDSSPE